jgi:3-deoxy-manno-octulosonate cytidylyltransferase (CMP-KDO synthetase)
MKTVVMIPSRLASTRFPGKPLVDIHGKPMIVRVYEQVQKSGVTDIFVAAGDDEIVEAVEAFGGQAVLTDPNLANGSDRIWAGLQTLIEDGMETPDIVINAQGDEPLLPPELIQESIKILSTRPDVDVVTFAHKISDPADINNPTKVKIATAPFNGEGGRALYFSRSPIPHGATEMLRHIGFYAYRYKALETYVNAKPGVLENTEKLEQLRGLELGLRYHVAITQHKPVGVDTQADLDVVLDILKPTDESDL